jgi:hypothetical protein
LLAETDPTGHSECSFHDTLIFTREFQEGGMAGNWPGSNNPEVFQIGIREMDKGAIAEPGKVWQRVQDIFSRRRRRPRTRWD